MEFIKKAAREQESDDLEIRTTVATMLDDIRGRDEAAVADYAEKFDGWRGDFVLSTEKRERLIANVPEIAMVPTARPGLYPSRAIVG